VFEVFSLLIGILIFDSSSGSTSAQVLTFEIFVLVMFGALFTSMFTSQIFCIVKKAKMENTLDTSSAIQVDIVGGNVVVSDAWKEALPEARLSTNPLNEGTLKPPPPKKKVIVTSVSSDPTNNIVELNEPQENSARHSQ
jgi:hypothetical protein